MFGKDQRTIFKVRHNEDELHKTMIDRLRIPFGSTPQFDSPHMKTNMLIQYHLSRLEFPRIDYVTDLKSCLDQIIRIIQALIDLAAHKAFLGPTILCIELLQMIIQARWITDDDIMTLPHIDDRSIARLCPLRLCQLLEKKHDEFTTMFSECLSRQQIDEIYEHVTRLPQIELNFCIRGFWSRGEETRTLPTSVHADQEYTLQITWKRLDRTRVSVRREIGVVS
jgi:activating signal cointegrator complex subunit 3